MKKMNSHTTPTTLILALLLVLPMYRCRLYASQPPSEPLDSIAQDSLFVLELPYPLILLDMPNVHIEQDSLVTLLMEEKIAGVERGEQERPGYRVQVYSSNHPQYGKTGALLLEQQLKQSLSQPVYVIYSSPSWKVRIGDFLTEEEAVAFRDEIKQLFPEQADYTYIVRDQVKIAK